MVSCERPLTPGAGRPQPAGVWSGGATGLTLDELLVLGRREGLAPVLLALGFELAERVDRDLRGRGVDLPELVPGRGEAAAAGGRGGRGRGRGRRRRRRRCLGRQRLGGGDRRGQGRRGRLGGGDRHGGGCQGGGEMEEEEAEAACRRRGQEGWRFGRRGGKRGGGGSTGAHDAERAR